MFEPHETFIWQNAEVSRWLHLHPEARALAPHILKSIDQVERYQQVEKNQILIREPGARRLELAKIQHELEADAPTWSKRRRAELALADYISTIPDPYNVHGLAEVTEKLRSCRQRGALGIKPNGGGHVIAWDSKCSMVRLCPDESREETQRLAEHYIPAIRDWVSAKPGRRVYYAVLTQHNYRPGSLAAGKAHQFEEFKDLLDLKYKACPVEFRKHHGEWSAIRPNKKRTIEAWPQIQGALVVQEDPLSASGDWNVHLNVILLVEGEFSYKRFRQDWGANVEIKQVDPADLTRTVLELVKYAAQTVAAKSDDKAAQGASEAPAMVDWSSDLWLEWWSAQRGFRRTRSYGCLYAVKAPEEETLDMTLVEWVGAVSFCPSSLSYRVDLIPGDNFSGPGEKIFGHAPPSAYNNPGGPPGCH